MKNSKSFFKIIAVVFLLTAGTESAFAQNFQAELRKLEGEIKAARKNKRLSELEYSKLMREQEIIKATIEKSMADNYMSPDEKNKINSKIIRSKKRFAKYKTNREVY